MSMKPMLAGKCTDASKLKYPILATPKLDGIRCLMTKDGPVSRMLKNIPNKHIFETMKKDLSHLPLDGELMVPGATFNQIQSHVMTMEGKPNFQYFVFDLIDTKKTYEQRMEDLRSLVLPSYVVKILPTQINTEEELSELEQKFLNEGYEGVMVRTPKSPYKYGRSTEREQYLLKIKRFEDSEAIILDFEELMHNTNEATIDNLGLTKRSSKKDGMVPSGILGSFFVQDVENGKRFKVSSGMTEEERALYWLERDNLHGKLLKYKFQPSGAKDLPRFPTFLGLRDEIDM